MSYDESLRSITLDADVSIGIFTGVPGLPGSLTPNSGKQFRWVKVTGPHIAGLCAAAANEIPLGVLQNKPQQVGDASTVGFTGVSFMEAGGTVTAGDGLKLDNTARPVRWVGGTDSRDLLVGVAITSAAVGQLFSGLVRPH